MSCITVRGSDVLPQAWRNGGGRTRELLAWPNAEGWSLRLSVAEIERDGPFSAFPGVERWFAVIEGAGVELGLAEIRRVLPGDPPLVFDGALAPACRLIEGPTRDLNLMLRGGAAGSMRAVEPGVAWSSDAPLRGLYAAAPGRCLDGEGLLAELPADALLWCDATPPGAWQFEARGWWIEGRLQP